MTPQQVLRSKRGQIIDLVSCLAVYKGAATEKKKKTFDEILAMR